jgi:hypothetical protein
MPVPITASPEPTARRNPEPAVVDIGAEAFSAEYISSRVGS